MKTLLLILLFTLQVIAVSQTPSKEYMARYNEKMERTEWWRNDRFGMFIHWGVYAVPARGEWVKSQEQLTTQEYQKYVDAFHPDKFDARKWAKTAKQAGMKYAVLTAKHHDGFCMFDSKLTDYDIANNLNGRDLVREFLDAFRAEGLKVGLYYSLIDWHHEDYPNVGNHPQRDDKQYAQKEFDWNNYLNYMHGQIEELLTQYGKIDVMWFDYSFEGYEGEKWGASKLIKMVRKHQPQIILDNRLEINHGVSSKEREIGLGDFETPEQAVPDKGIVDKYGNPLPWETCLTLNNNWGFHAGDHEWKSPELIIHTLVDITSNNGNLLLNVGPDARGEIPDKSVEILTEVGNWLEKNGESIYGCGSSTLPQPVWGRYTQNDKNLYLHWMYPTIGHIDITHLAGKVDFATILSSGAEAAVGGGWFGNNTENSLFINIQAPTYKTYVLPDEYNTVFKLELK